MLCVSLSHSLQLPLLFQPLASVLAKGVQEAVAQLPADTSLCHDQ